MNIHSIKLLTTSQPPNKGKTALDEYVWAKDNNYGWTELEDHEIHGKGILHFNKGWTGYTLNVTSQQWLTPEDFSNTSSSGSIWYHILVVIVPDEVKYKNNASMYITGWGQPNPDGSNLPTAKDEDIRTAAAWLFLLVLLLGVFSRFPTNIQHLRLTQFRRVEVRTLLLLSHGTTF